MKRTFLFDGREVEVQMGFDYDLELLYKVEHIRVLWAQRLSEVPGICFLTHSELSIKQLAYVAEQLIKSVPKWVGYSGVEIGSSPGPGGYSYISIPVKDTAANMCKVKRLMELVIASEILSSKDPLNGIFEFRTGMEQNSK